MNSSCGIHIHIDSSKHSAVSLKNIVNIIAAKEDLLYKTLKINVQRERYCRKTDTSFLDRLNNTRVFSLRSIGHLWYNDTLSYHGHYHDSRYHGLNLHSVFDHGTIEFRLFNSTLHAGEIKSYIQLCLAISHQALMQKRAHRAKTVSDNEKYTFRTWLLRLGLIGDEYKTARFHLLKNLEGNIAWRDPAQAERAKEKLRSKRWAEITASLEQNELEEQEEEEQAEDSSFVLSIN